MARITTFTLFRYKGFRNKFWALSQMGLAHRQLKCVPGQLFYKMLGTGKAGFSTSPDWTVYGLLQVWDTESAAEEFFRTHPQMKAFGAHTLQHLCLFMHPIRSRGQWNGGNPFKPSTHHGAEEGPIAVVTRATIRKRYLHRFWKYVPRSQRPLGSMPGLLYSKGIGETPFIDMATISLWESSEAMERYAYGTEAHRGAIQKTRQLGWYREELFARFRLYRAEGSWEGMPQFNVLMGGPDRTDKGR